MSNQKLSDLEPLIREALSTWQLFRRLGFSSDDIYIALNEGSLLITVKWRGKGFSVRVGATEMTPQMLAQVWDHAAGVMATADPDELQSDWDNSAAAKEMPGIVLKLELLEIYWPNHSKFQEMN